jgi:hypothetical protein
MNKPQFLRRTILLVASLLVLFLLTMPASAQGPGRSGFRALRDQDARAFQLPNDMQLTTSEQVARANLTAERYQQLVGGVPVLGGQLTIYRDNAGQSVAVIGSHYSNLVATNQVQLNPGQARDIALSQGGTPGNISVDLLIDPSTGRYFFRVEN